MHKITVLYPQGELNEEYYAQSHGPLLKRHAEAIGLRRFFYEKPQPGPDGAQPPFRIIAHLFFDDAAAVERAMTRPEMGEVVKDIRNFFPGRPQVIVSEVVEA